MAQGRFTSDGVRRVQEKIGEGVLQGKVEVDQVYAQNQHESTWFRHPHGGQAKYLETPLYGNAPKYLQHLADGALKEGLVNAMKDNVEDLATNELGTYAPVEHGYLRDSGRAIVTDNGAEVYNKAPGTGRLSEEQLRSRGISE